MNHFQTTRWSLVLEAREDTARSRPALEKLCQTYRAPVLAFIRSRGASPDEAEDLAQAFFARFIERAFHAHADPARGRFRAFLLTALKNFLADARDHDRAAKRGGQVMLRSFDTSGANDSIEAIGGGETPEEAFDRAWTQAVLQSAMRALRREARKAGKAPLFAALGEFLIEPPDETDYARVAAELGMRRNTLAVAVHRLRNRLRQLVRKELGDTAAEGDDLEAEMTRLRHSLGTLLE